MPCPFHKTASPSENKSAVIPFKKPPLTFYGISLLKLLVLRNLEKVLANGFNKMGDLFQARTYLFMKGLKNLRFLFSADPKYMQRAPISEAGPTSLATMDGAKQIAHKKFVMQAFKKNYLLRYAKETVTVSLEFFDKLRGEVDIQKDMMRLATIIVLNSLLGLNDDNSEFDSFLNGYNIMSKRGSEKKTRKSSFQKAMKIKPILWGQIRYLLQDRAINPSNDILSAFNSERKKCPSITDENAQNYIYMLAEFGQEDLGMILTFALSTLGYYRNFRETLLAEVKSITSPNPSIEEVTSLPFLKFYIQELERLFPPVPYFLRYVVEDTLFKGHLIKKETTIVASIYHSHTDSNIFKDPMEFNPRRYLSESQKYVLAFGGGYHMCPAKQYIYMQVRLILFSLLRHYKIENTNQKPYIIYSPRTGLKNNIKLRINKL